jgi:hypothetical protein
MLREKIKIKKKAGGLDCQSVYVQRYPLDYSNLRFASHIFLFFADDKIIHILTGKVQGQDAVIMNLNAGNLFSNQVIKY